MLSKPMNQKYNDFIQPTEPKCENLKKNGYKTNSQDMLVVLIKLIGFSLFKDGLSKILLQKKKPPCI